MAYFDGTDPCWVADAPYAKELEWRLRTSQFGDGYQQRILDGINALNFTFNVSFYRDQNVLVAMDNYLQSQKAAAFSYRDPTTSILYSVFCDKWNISWDVKRRRDPVSWIIQWYGTLTASFVKANGVQIGPIT